MEIIITEMAQIRLYNIETKQMENHIVVRYFMKHCNCEYRLQDNEIYNSYRCLGKEMYINHEYVNSDCQEQHNLIKATIIPGQIFDYNREQIEAAIIAKELSK